MTATELRKNLYRTLDRALATGEAVSIERNGRIVRLVPDQPGCDLDRLVPHPDSLTGSPDDIVHIDWSHAWRP